MKSYQHLSLLHPNSSKIAMGVGMVLNTSRGQWCMSVRFQRALHKWHRPKTVSNKWLKRGYAAFVRKGVKLYGYELSGKIGLLDQLNILSLWHSYNLC